MELRSSFRLAAQDWLSCFFGFAVDSFAANDWLSRLTSLNRLGKARGRDRHSRLLIQSPIRAPPTMHQARRACISLR